MKSAQECGEPDFTAVSAEIIERWGFDTRLTGELARELTPERGHTVDHVNCPACQAYDTFVKSDLHGMAGQKFLDAARVWLNAQRKSDKLKPRSLETLGENLRALNKFFKDIRMSSINPGMLKAYQQARLLKHLANRLARKPKLPRRRPPAHPLHQNRPPHPCV
jgi:hypothetical protein